MSRAESQTWFVRGSSRWNWLAARPSRLVANETLISPRIRASLALPFQNVEYGVLGTSEQISSGVQFIHDCEEVHRDLKPRNG